MGRWLRISTLSLGVVCAGLAAAACGGSDSASSPTTPTNPGPPSPGTPSFVGTYNISMAKVSETCSEPIQNVGPWTLTLQGTAASLTATITAIGTQNPRTYMGSMQADGTFTTSVTSNVVTSHGWGPYHDTRGSVQGRVTGNSVNGTESLTYGAPCDGATAVLAFSGSK